MVSGGRPPRLPRPPCFCWPAALLLASGARAIATPPGDQAALRAELEGRLKAAEAALDDLRRQAHISRSNDAPVRRSIGASASVAGAPAPNASARASDAPAASSGAPSEDVKQGGGVPAVGGSGAGLSEGASVQAPVGGFVKARDQLRTVWAEEAAKEAIGQSARNRPEDLGTQGTSAEEDGEDARPPGGAGMGNNLNMPGGEPLGERREPPSEKENFRATWEIMRANARRAGAASGTRAGESFPGGTVGGRRRGQGSATDLWSPGGTMISHLPSGQRPEVPGGSGSNTHHIYNFSRMMPGHRHVPHAGHARTAAEILNLTANMTDWRSQANEETFHRLAYYSHQGDLAGYSLLPKSYAGGEEQDGPWENDTADERLGLIVNVAGFASGVSTQPEPWEALGCYELSQEDLSSALPGKVEGVRDVSCSSFGVKDTDKDALCRSGLPFYRFVINDITPGLCKDYCLSKGLDLAGVVQNKECRCGATRRVQALWNFRALPTHLHFQPEGKKVSYGQNCDIIAYKYIDEMNDFSIPERLMARTTFDHAYVQALVCASTGGNCNDEAASVS